MFANTRAFFGLLATAALFVLQSQAIAQVAGRTPERPATVGFLKSYDAATGKITILLGESRQDEKTFSLSKTVEVATGNNFQQRGLLKETKLADVAPGAMVFLTLDKDDAVESIVAEGPNLRARIASVDSAKRTVTVSVQPRPTGRGEVTAEPDKTYAVSSDAEIGIDDGRGKRFSLKEATLAEIPAGAGASIRLSPDQKQVVSITAEAPQLQGTLRSAKPGENSLTIAVPAGRGEESGEEKSLKLADGAVVMIDDGRGRRLSIKEATLLDIPAGAMVYVRLTPDSSAVTMLRAEGPTLPALIKSVDADKRTVTFSARASRTETPDDKTLPLAEDVRVMLDRNVTPLADVKIGADGQFGMLRLTLDQKSVQGITTFPQR